MTTRLSPDNLKCLNESLACIHFLPKKTAIAELAIDDYKEYTIPQLREIAYFLESAGKTLSQTVRRREADAKLKQTKKTNIKFSPKGVDTARKL